MATTDEKRETLLTLIHEFKSAAVALSGGVDSAVVAKAAHIALGEKAVAVTNDSPSLASGELDLARQVAAQIGIRHKVIQTDEINDSQYVQNAADRCYHCKSHLYDQMESILMSLGVAVMCNGANADDLGDYRPGMDAAAEHSVRSPLAECGLTKADVRELAHRWELPVWDKPASPCLASRIAYGEEVTSERLRMIDSAEQFLRTLGLPNVRVRFHRGDLARLEVPTDAIAQLAESAVRQRVFERLKKLGFRYVTLDLEGFRSGSLNDMLPMLENIAPPGATKPHH